LGSESNSKTTCREGRLGQTGITTSNTRLAEGLYIARRNINAAVGRLKKRGLLIQVGAGHRRRLVASPEVLMLPKCDESSHLTGMKHPTSMGRNIPPSGTNHPQKWDETSHITKVTEDNLTLSRESAAFIAPTLEEVKQYIAEKNLSVDAEEFHSYFAAGGVSVLRGHLCPG
jgi:biotin operon repressor